jgi:hypothetical protein
MALYKRYFMTQAANLLMALKGVADPYSPTRSIYDNTVVLIGSEGPIQAVGGSDVHGNGDPNADQPFIVAGGCGGYFKMGQLLFAGGAKTANVNHNALLTNIVNTFGFTAYNRCRRGSGALTHRGAAGRAAASDPSWKRVALGRVGRPA